MPNTGAISGAASGAAQGFAVGGVVGAAIGGIVGGIGGMFSDDAAKYARKADKMREEAALLQSFLERRALVQQYQVARSGIMAGGLASGAGVESSGIQGAQAAVTTATRSNLHINAQQVYMERLATKYMRKAGKNQAMGGSILGALDAGLSIYGASSTPSSGYSASAQRGGTGSYSGTSRPLSAPPIAMPTTINTSPFTSR